MRALIVIGIFIALYSSSFAQDRKNEQKKRVYQTYPLSSSDKVRLSNKFGEIKINTWTKNEIEVEVNITTWAGKADNAVLRLQSIDIDHGKSGGVVQFETEIKQNSSQNSNGGFQIDYTVNMPANATLNVDNKFGTVYIGNYQGELNMNVEFGHLSAGKLTGSTIIEVKHGSGSIEEITNGNVISSFCKFMEVKKAGMLDADDKHGKLSIGDTRELNVKSAYSSLEIKNIEKSIQAVSSFGSVNVESISPSFSLVSVKSSYGSCSLDLSGAPNFKFEINVSYGSFHNSLSSIITTTSIEKNTSAVYEGKRGSGGSGLVKVDSSYGSIKFK